MSATTMAFLHVAGGTASGQAATSGPMNSDLSIVATGDAVVWTYLDGRDATLYSASAPDYRPSRLSARPVGESDVRRDAAGMLSPDGSWILYLRDGLLYRLPASAGAVGREAVEPTPLFQTIGLITHAAWSPDGSRIAFVMAAPKLRSLPADRSAEVPSFVGIFDLASGRRWFLSPRLTRDASPVWSPDGSEIFFQRGEVEGLPLHDPVGSCTIPGTVEASPFNRGSSSLMVGEVESGEVRTLWSNVGDEVVLIGTGGSSQEAVPPAGHPVAPPLANRASR